MAPVVLAIIISLAALAAGAKYLAEARKMRSFKTRRGRVIDREVVPVTASLGREGRWGRGGNFQPKVTYSYVVDDIEYRSDRWSYGTEGFKRSVAERKLTEVFDDVLVHYNPADPRQAYLEVTSPTVGYALVAGGSLGLLIALAALLS